MHGSHPLACPHIAHTRHAHSLLTLAMPAHCSHLPCLLTAHTCHACSLLTLAMPAHCSHLPCPLIAHTCHACSLLTLGMPAHCSHLPCLPIAYTCHACTLATPAYCPHCYACSLASIANCLRAPLLKSSSGTSDHSAAGAYCTSTGHLPLSRHPPLTSEDAPQSHRYLVDLGPPSTPTCTASCRLQQGAQLAGSV